MLRGKRPVSAYSAVFEQWMDTFKKRFIQDVWTPSIFVTSLIPHNLLAYPNTGSTLESKSFIKTSRE